MSRIDMTECGEVWVRGGRGSWRESGFSKRGMEMREGEAGGDADRLNEGTGDSGGVAEILSWVIRTNTRDDQVARIR
jgi:hypothetical protein